MVKLATGFGVSRTGASDPHVPGVPAFSSSEQFAIITASNDVLKISYDGGAVTDVTLSSGVYTYATLATEIESKLDSALGCSSTVTYLATTTTQATKFTLDSGSGKTFALTYSGSTAAVTLGFDDDQAAAQTITSDRYVHGTGTITFTFSANENADEVVYAIYSNIQSKYVGADGVADEASEVWQTRANWNNGGATGTVTVISLTDYTNYTFKIKAKNELDVESDFCANSSNMNVFPLIDYGEQSESLSREVTGGNTRVVNTSSDSPIVDSTHLYGDIPLTFTLQNNYETASRVVIEYSEDGGSNYSTATDFFTISSSNDVLNFTSDEGGPVDIDVADGTYTTGAAMATVLQTAMNANNTLTGTGTITFGVTFSTTTTKYTIDAGAGHWIKYNHFATNVDGGFTYGFTESNTEGDRTITTDRARGEPIVGLTTDETGVSHTIYWDSYTDAGESEQITSNTKLRLTPYDTSPSGGDAGTAVATSAFTLNNRPVQVTLVNFDTFSWDEDTTPIFSTIMGNIRGGNRLYFRIKIYDANDDLIAIKSSAILITNWQYEDTTDSWNDCPIGGVDPQYIDGVNRIRYTVQSGDALSSAVGDNPHSVFIEQGEVRDRN